MNEPDTLPSRWKNILEKATPGIVGAIIIGIGTALLSALSSGAVISLMQGVTKAEKAEIQQQIDQLKSQPKGMTDIELKEEIKRQVTQVSSAPKGMIGAFNLTKCPDGWINFDVAAGRVIVGAGAGPGLTERRLFSSGGFETHTLTIDEIPAHTHTGNVGTGGESWEHHQGNSRLPGTAWQPQTGYTGGGKPHNIMPPFFVLLYCQKL